MAAVVTIPWLREEEACEEQIDIVEAEWGDTNIVLTQEVLQRAVELELNLEWVANHIDLTPAARLVFWNALADVRDAFWAAAKEARDRYFPAKAAFKKGQMSEQAFLVIRHRFEQDKVDIKRAHDVGRADALLSAIQHDEP